MTRPRRHNSAHSVPEWAKALRERRFQLGLSQEQVEEKSGGVIAQKTVSAAENGATPLLGMAVSRLRSYARALNWTLKDMQEATGLDLVYLLMSQTGHWQAQEIHHADTWLWMAQYRLNWSSFRYTQSPPLGKASMLRSGTLSVTSR